ncbi:MAG: M56 family metallopeptidase, partial [Planctomycetota bacterium]
MTPEAPLAGALPVLLTYAVHSTALLGLAWLGLRVRGIDPLVRSRAWKAALLGGLLTTAAQLGLGVEPLGGRFAVQPSTPTVADDAPLLATVRTPDGPSAAPSLDAQQLAALELALLKAAAAAPVEAAEQADGFWSRVLGWAWLSGVGYGLLLVFARRGRFRSRVRDRLPVWDERALASLRALRTKAGLRRRVRLSRSRSLRVPATWGWLRPEICLPDRALDELTPDELEAVLAHELGHVVRGDALWLTVGQCLAALCFFQPLNRVARRGLALESEHLADRFAVELTGKPVSLAKSLARVATWLDPRAGQAEPAVATMAAS